MDINEYKDKSSQVINRYLEIKKYIDINVVKSNISQLEKLSLSKDFWSDADTAKNNGTRNPSYNFFLTKWKISQFVVNCSTSSFTPWRFFN